MRLSADCSDATAFRGRFKEISNTQVYEPIHVQLFSRCNSSPVIRQSASRHTWMPRCGHPCSLKSSGGEMHRRGSDHPQPQSVKFQRPCHTCQLARMFPEESRAPACRISSPFCSHCQPTWIHFTLHAPMDQLPPARLIAPPGSCRVTYFARDRAVKSFRPSSFLLSGLRNTTTWKPRKSSYPSNARSDLKLPSGEHKSHRIFIPCTPNPTTQT
jgi:hypothetical protein